MYLENRSSNFLDALQAVCTRVNGCLAVRVHDRFYRLVFTNKISVISSQSGFPEKRLSALVACQSAVIRMPMTVFVIV